MRRIVPVSPPVELTPPQAVDRLLSILTVCRSLPPEVRARLAGLLETEARALRGEPDPVRVWAAMYYDDPVYFAEALDEPA